MMRIITGEESGLEPEIAGYYTLLTETSDGRICGVGPLLFHWTVHIGITFMGYADRYCYATQADAEAALLAWDGRSGPSGWHRHPATGRRRDPATGREWVAA